MKTRFRACWLASASVPAQRWQVPSLWAQLQHLHQRGGSVPDGQDHPVLHHRPSVRSPVNVSTTLLAADACDLWGCSGIAVTKKNRNKNKHLLMGLLGKKCKLFFSCCKAERREVATSLTSGLCRHFNWYLTHLTSLLCLFIISVNIVLWILLTGYCYISQISRQIRHMIFALCENWLRTAPISVPIKSILKNLAL